jgi:class 3 adenylate cyclase
MNAGSLPKQLWGWKALYVAALFENDKPRVAQRIAEAQAAILSRRRELTISAADVRERHALDNALFSLAALRTCLSILPPVFATNLKQHITG